jgi:2,5-diamino-6-(ribosylamino)-4(3H)-pyrimidinone 5'-phosphate reductase
MSHPTFLVVPTISAARHLPPAPSGSSHHLPRPVIIDTNLRLPPTCKLLRNFQNGQGRRPWVVCASGDSEEWRQRLEALENAGATILQVSKQGSIMLRKSVAYTLTLRLGDGLSILAVLTTLRQEGIRSLMVEGGAQIIASFLAAKSSIGEYIVDSIIVTVAPTIVGDSGVGYGVENLVSFVHTRRT